LKYVVKTAEYSLKFLPKHHYTCYSKQPFISFYQNQTSICDPILAGTAKLDFQVWCRCKSITCQNVMLKQKTFGARKERKYEGSKERHVLDSFLKVLDP